MKISEQWLRQWVNPPVDSDTLAEQLTMLGLEVDDSSPVAAPFSHVVVGEVVSVEPHPDADRLRVTRVNVGSDHLLQIVCGAPNVRVGMKAPVALVGAVLPQAVHIKKGKLRGVDSEGMLCGASEIDLEDQIDGLLELPHDAPIGQDIRDYLQLDDRVIDISITPNRGDCFSVRGIARELAVINQMTYQPPHIQPIEPQHQDQLAIEVQTDAVPRYLGCIIKQVDAKAATPSWMQRALMRSGLRPHSILVDITNYVMLELGQPLHAFDLAQIQGHIIVRSAQSGETLTLLNEQQVTLQHDVTVIADEVKVLAIGGIMGGLESSISETTQDIFLESAFFDPLAIAGRARRFGLHTDASQRFERGVDFELPLLALQRACQFIAQYANGQIGNISQYEATARLPQRMPIQLTAQQVDDLLGFHIEARFIVDTLTRLECQVDDKGDHWAVTPPSHRYDLNIYQDLIEEIARIYGYNNIPIRMPNMPIELRAEPDQSEQGQLRQVLATLGYQEAISFSFVDEKIQRALNPKQRPLTLANPISSELGVMRSSLISSLIPSLQHNLNRQQERVRLFELGLRFVSQDESSDVTLDNLQQIATLALIATGNFYPEQWNASDRSMDFYDLKGDIEHILQFAQLQAQFRSIEKPWLHPGQSADIYVNGQSIGYCGSLHPALSQQLDLNTTWVAELDLDQVLRPLQYRFTEISRFPIVRRDIAVIIDDRIKFAQIEQTIQREAGQWLVNYWLFDVYTGENITSGHRSLAFALQFQHPERTLEEAEIKNVFDRIIHSLQSNYNAKLRDS